MKTRMQLLIPLATIVALQSVHAADQAKPEAKPEKRELRVISGPERDRRVMIHRGQSDEGEMETVAFLGVETGPVSPAVSTQLGLQRGTGLVVNHIVPKSPAVGVLQQHDILLKLDDQILIETRQLAVLIRNKKEGDEVTLTYLRGGKQSTAKVKLGKHEVPKFSLSSGPGPGGFVFGLAPGRFDTLPPTPEGGRENVDHLLRMIEPRRGDNPVRMHIDRQGSPGFRATTINTENSNLVYSDDDGSLELTVSDGKKTLVAKNAKGEPLFSGPVTTGEERQALPAGVRERLEKLEGMRDVTFRTDGEFRGAETKVIRPRGIRFDLPPAPPQPGTLAPLPRRMPTFL